MEGSKRGEPRNARLRFLTFCLEKKEPPPGDPGGGSLLLFRRNVEDVISCFLGLTRCANHPRFSIASFERF